MTEIIAENPRFASSHSTLSRVLRDRALQAARAFHGQVRRFEMGLIEQEEDEECGILDTTYEEQEEYSSQREREEWERGQDIQRGCEIMRARAVRPRVPAPRTQARIRARRSPTCTRRATADSGGNDDGGSGDPEPPRPPHLYSLPAYAFGGAL